LCFFNCKSEVYCPRCKT